MRGRIAGGLKAARGIDIRGCIMVGRVAAPKLGRKFGENRIMASAAWHEKANIMAGMARVLRAGCMACSSARPGVAAPRVLDATCGEPVRAVMRAMTSPRKNDTTGTDSMVIATIDEALTPAISGLAVGVNENDIAARFKNGVLTPTLPKLFAPQGPAKTVEAKAA